MISSDDGLGLLSLWLCRPALSISHAVKKKVWRHQLAHVSRLIIPVLCHAILNDVPQSCHTTAQTHTAMYGVQRHRQRRVTWKGRFFMPVASASRGNRSSQRIYWFTVKMGMGSHPISARPGFFVVTLLLSHAPLRVSADLVIFLSVCQM